MEVASPIHLAPVLIDGHDVTSRLDVLVGMAVDQEQVSTQPRSDAAAVWNVERHGGSGSSSDQRLGWCKSCFNIKGELAVKAGAIGGPRVGRVSPGQDWHA